MLHLSLKKMVFHPARILVSHKKQFSIASILIENKLDGLIYTSGNYGSRWKSSKNIHRRAKYFFENIFHMQSSSLKASGADLPKKCEFYFFCQFEAILQLPGEGELKIDSLYMCPKGFFCYNQHLFSSYEYIHTGTEPGLRG